MPVTNYALQLLVQEMFGGVAYSSSATLYVAVSTTTPTQVKGSAPYWNFTEPSGGAYARVAMTNNGTNFVEVSSPPTNGWEQANGTTITFTTATGAWGTCTYFGIFDASTAGNLLGFGLLTPSQVISSGGTPSFAVQSLTILGS